MLSWKLPLPPVGATSAVSYKGDGPMNVFLVWALGGILKPCGRQRGEGAGVLKMSMYVHKRGGGL